jgi:hypothetical protein
LALIISRSSPHCKLPSMKLRNQKDPNENGSIKSTKKRPRTHNREKEG